MIGLWKWVGNVVDILIVEDNIEICTLLSDFLKAEGYSVQIENDGKSALDYFFQSGAKLVLLDIMLPEMDGFAVCQAIREKNDTPIIVLSARVEKEYKLKGLVLGADDYIEKPYDIDILLAKIRGIFRRRYQVSQLVCGDLCLQKDAHRVTKAGQELKMTVKEFELLQLLMENQGKTLTKEALFSRVWGSDSFSELQTLTVHIKWLREKIEKDAKKPTHILTVWGVGYRFEG